ncbi:MAG: hypothetical protein MPJ25_00435 [Pirellulales bacterium]|nr:hypothetical protein [Pirellulales bacterium]
MAEWKVKSVNDVPIEELNKQKEEKNAELKEEQKEAIKGPEAPKEEVAAKIDLSQTKTEDKDAVQQVQGETKEGVLRDEGVDKKPEEEVSPIELITEEKTEEVKDETNKVDQAGVEPVVTDAPPAQEQKEVLQEEPKVNLPENVEKLVKFMEDTGGTVEDYVNLNKDLTTYSEHDLLFEYYKQTKGWTPQEIREHINDTFTYDKEVDDPKNIRAIDREYKAELRTAKDYLQSNRDKYYEELKLRPRQDVDPAYKEAYDFHSKFKESQQANNALQQTFIEKTDSVFKDLKGFDFKVGENTYRYKVNEPAKVKEAQSDINNFVSQFIGDDGAIQDAPGYHKALFAARNADKLAQHFYEQGRADALKNSAADAKNIDMSARATHDTSSSDKAGPKARVVQSDGFGSKLKFRNYSRTK